MIGPGQGDLEAEGLDLADVVTELTAGAGTGLVLARAEASVPGSRAVAAGPSEMMTRMERCGTDHRADAENLARPPRITDAA
jgi:hypothetical protein